MGLSVLTDKVPCSLFLSFPKSFSKRISEMPKSKAELQVEIRELIKGTPMRMPLSMMKRHELEVALVVAQELKLKGENALGPPVKRGPLGPRQVPVSHEQDEEGNTVIVPHLPGERLMKAPLVNKPGAGQNMKAKYAKKEVTIEEPSGQAKSGRKTYCPCNCPSCPHK
jgi:hypothetical protein